MNDHLPVSCPASNLFPLWSVVSKLPICLGFGQKSPSIAGLVKGTGGLFCDCFREIKKPAPAAAKATMTILGISIRLLLNRLNIPPLYLKAKADMPD